MDESTKQRIRELLFYVVPDPDEEITNDVLARSEAVDYDEGQKLNAEFRSIFESMNEDPGVCRAVLSALDGIETAGSEVRGEDTEWISTCDARGRRIHRALAQIL